jgi:glycogen debranching enzyme
MSADRFAGVWSIRLAGGPRTVLGWVVACLLALAPYASAGQATSGAPPDAASAVVERFAIAPSPIGLTGDVRPHQYLGVVGRRAAWLGAETGAAELWVHPLKLAAGFQLAFRIPDYAEPVRGADVARTVEIRPEITTITYSHATFTVRQHILAPLDLPGLLVLLEVDTYRPLDIVAGFQTAFQYAWPGGLGGQYGTWDAETRAFLLSESLRRHNAFIGSPWAAEGSSHPAHALPDAPSQFVMHVDPARARREFVPIAIAAGIAPRHEVLATYHTLLREARALYEARRAHADRLRTGALSIRTPDRQFDLALEWAKVNLAEQLVCNPDLGCGLVAGWGPSGRGARPGFGWFFGGDAAINSLAMSGAGLWDDVAAGLRFLAKYQRADGKIAHEISQAAGRLPWFTEFPYAYYHADTTPFWILAVWRYWLASGDRGLVTDVWPQVSRAYAWCAANDGDQDGLIENTTAGLGAIEVGEIGRDIHQDVYLAAVWLESLRAMQALGEVMGDAATVADARRRFERGSATLNERYWIEQAGHHAFGLLRSGGTNDALTVWPATAASFGLLAPERARRTLAQLAGPGITTDWGARMLVATHRLYEPTHYNMGAVWPFVTGFVALGHYRYERPWSGWPLVRAIAQMGSDFARGRHPELLSGAYYRPLDTAVPHQFFATSMLVTPLVSGLVGWTPDAPRGAARLAPQLPPQWDRARVENLRAGSRRLDVDLVRTDGAVDVTLRASGGDLTLDYVLAPPAGAADVQATADGRAVSVQARDGARHVALTLREQPVVLRVSWRGGLEVVPEAPDLRVGQAPTPAQVVDFRWTGTQWELEVEGVPGAARDVRLRGTAAGRVEGAEVVERSPTGLRLRVVLDGARRDGEAPAPAFVRQLVVVRDRH